MATYNLSPSVSLPHPLPPFTPHSPCGPPHHALSLPARIIPPRHADLRRNDFRWELGLATTEAGGTVNNLAPTTSTSTSTSTSSTSTSTSSPTSSSEALHDDLDLLRIVHSVVTAADELASLAHRGAGGDMADGGLASALWRDVDSSTAHSAGGWAPSVEEWVNPTLAARFAAQLEVMGGGEGVVGVSIA